MWFCVCLVGLVECCVEGFCYCCLMVFVGCGVIRWIVWDCEFVGGWVVFDVVWYVGCVECFVEFFGVVGGEWWVVFCVVDVDGGVDLVG